MGKQAIAGNNLSLRLADGSKITVSKGQTVTLTDAEYAALDSASTAALPSPSTVADPVRISASQNAHQLPLTTTAARPSAVGKQGQTLYDVTLGLPIYSNGAVWKNAAGTTV